MQRAASIRTVFERRHGSPRSHRTRDLTRVRSPPPFWHHRHAVCADDPANTVVALCAEGMAAEGTPADARRLFERAWAARRDDYDAAIAAHFVARHQATPADALHWNALAVRHAEAVA